MIVQLQSFRAFDRCFTESPLAEYSVKSDPWGGVVPLCSRRADGVVLKKQIQPAVPASFRPPPP